MPRILMVSSAVILLVLGIVHIVYTYSGSKLWPRDPAVQLAMSQSHLGITKETTVWRAWTGFNVSHSMAAILFGLIYAFLAVAHPQILFGSGYLLAVGFATLLGFVMLAKLYWFSVPFAGVTTSLVLYIASVVSARSG